MKDTSRVSPVTSQILFLLFLFLFLLFLFLIISTCGDGGSSGSVSGCFLTAAVTHISRVVSRLSK